MESRRSSKSLSLPSLASPAASTGENPGSLRDRASGFGKAQKSRRSSRRKSKRSNSLKIPKLPKTAPTALDRSASDGALRSEGRARGLSSSSGPFIVRERFWYVVQYGNNGPLIRQCMLKRPGWSFRTVRVVRDEAPCAHFVWTCSMHRATLDAMAACERIGHAKPRDSQSRMMHNHFEGIEKLCTKHELCENLTAMYEAQGCDPFFAMPLTFVITGKSNFADQTKWRNAFERIKAKTGEHMWIVKPSSGSRGVGIVLCESSEDIAAKLESVDPDSYWVVQKYLERPFLFHGRKFDLRSYCLILQDPRCGTFRAYFYPEVFLKTCGALYNTDSCDKFAHITNGPVQCQGENFGQFEDGNKLSWKAFQQYLDENYKEQGFSFAGQILPQMKKLTADAVSAVVDFLNPRNIRNCFQVVGFDFMIDASFKVWLIEVNGNPCLEISSSCLEDIIPKMCDEALRLALDRLFPGATEGGCLATIEPTAWELVFCSAEAAALT